MALHYDLHTHSTVSDGTTPPADLAAEARAAGLAGFALTDHDTADGWPEARSGAVDHGIDFLPGIELTTHTGKRSAHLLAYGPDPRSPRLHDEMGALRSSRQDRARLMAGRLAEDFAVDWGAVIERAGTSVGRPHLADALVEAGYVADRSAAFASVLAPGGRYYMPIYALDTCAAIRIVREAGGVPVLAHPAANRQRSPFSHDELAELVAAGLWGIELDHPENAPEWLPALRESAAALGLMVTGASDYHGTGKPNRLGDCTTDGALVELIRAEVATPR